MTCLVPAMPASLSRREVDVLRAMCRDMRAKEIAYALGITLFTVRNYQNRMFLKLGVQNGSAAVRLAILNPSILRQGDCSDIRHRVGCGCEAPSCRLLREEPRK